MRDWLATLLQVSFAARSKGDDLSECLSQWRPLLSAVSASKGVSESELLCDCMVRSLQIMDGVQPSEAAMHAFSLPSSNDRMGCSLIETRLDDHALSHVFGFLDCKDVCTSIERVCHRFLQCSRNRRVPFHQRCLDWKTFDGDSGEWIADSYIRTPFARLLFSQPNLPKVINLRSFARFQIDELRYDPELATEYDCTYHPLRFEEVIRSIHTKDLRRCHLASPCHTGEPCYFPSEISHIATIQLHSSSAEELTDFCKAFPNCQSLKLWFSMLDSPDDLGSLNNLTKLETLFVSGVGFESTELMYESRMLDPTKLASLAKLTISSDLLPQFQSILTANIRTLELTFPIPVLDQSCAGDLSGLHNLNLMTVCDSANSTALRRQFRWPTRIRRMRVCCDWMTLVDWVGSVDELDCSIRRDANEPSIDPLIPSSVQDTIVDRWSVKQCHLIIQRPQLDDIRMLIQLMKNANESMMEVHLSQVNENVQGMDDLTQELDSLVKQRHDCSLNVTNLSLVSLI